MLIQGTEQTIMVITESPQHGNLSPDGSGFCALAVAGYRRTINPASLRIHPQHQNHCRQTANHQQNHRTQQQPV